MPGFVGIVGQKVQLQPLLKIRGTMPPSIFYFPTIFIVEKGQGKQQLLKYMGFIRKKQKFAEHTRIIMQTPRINNIKK